MNWKDIIALDDEQLQAKGVSALGARRKMLKVFEMVKSETKPAQAFVAEPAATEPAA